MRSMPVPGACVKLATFAFVSLTRWLRIGRNTPALAKNPWTSTTTSSLGSELFRHDGGDVTRHERDLAQGSRRSRSRGGGTSAGRRVK